MTATDHGDRDDGPPGVDAEDRSPTVDFHLDSNVFDAFVADEANRRAAVAAVRARRASFSTTHIEEDELSAVP